MQRLLLAEEDFAQKQQEFKDQIKMFEKFITETDRKREFTIEKTEEEIRQIIEKMKEIKQKEAVKSSLQRDGAGCKQELDELEIYAHYLKSCLHQETLTAEHICDLLQRHSVLCQTRSQLIIQKSIVQDKCSEIREQMKENQDSIQTKILVKNNKLTGCQRELEHLTQDIAKKENQIVKRNLKVREKNIKSSQIRFSIANVYSRMLTSYVFKTPLIRKFKSKQEGTQKKSQYAECETKFLLTILHDVGLRLKELDVMRSEWLKKPDKSTMR